MSAHSLLSERDKELETRFAHLLNPIRDLSKNWDVDIASSLENYLTELEAVTITFDDGKTTMNFVQAAFLIQGSTSVYSRKVEFLYMLVQEMLQLLAKKKRSQQPSSIDSQGQDKDTEFMNKESDHDFLPLDDIAINKHVDLKDGGNTKKKASLLPKTPSFFIPLDESEKGDMLLSLKGEPIGNKNDFKLGIASLNLSGMLLLDVENGVPMERDGKLTPLPPHDLPATITDLDGDSRPPSPAMSTHSMGCDANMCNASPERVPDNISNYNENVNVAVTKNNNECEKSRYNLRARKKKDVLHEVNRMEAADPFENTKKDRPFKKGNVLRIIDELKPETIKKRRTRKTKEKSKETLSKLSTFCSIEYLSDRSKFSNKALKIPTFMELNRLYWQEQKERQKNIEYQKEVEPVNIIPTEEEDHSDIDEGICDDYLAGGDFGCDMAEPLQPVDNTGDKIFEQQNNFDKLIGCTYEDLVRDHVEKYMTTAEKYGQVTELTKRVQEWEERILPVLEQEEEMEPFDIHEYGTKVLNRFSANNRKQTLTFREIVKKQKKRQVARYFLASLQLANSQNVSISKHEEFESSINTMELTLLSRVRHHEQLDDYVAPSLQAS